MKTDIQLIEQLAVRAGMTSLLNHGAASLVFTEGVAGVSQEQLVRFAEHVALHCVAALGASRLQEKEGQPAAFLVTNLRSGEPSLCFEDERGDYGDEEHTPVFTPLFAGSQAVQVPGWKLAPVEPMEEMLDEGAHQIYEPTNRNDLERVWSVMLNAAPLQPLADGEG